MKSSKLMDEYLALEKENANRRDGKAWTRINELAVKVGTSGERDALLNRFRYKPGDYPEGWGPVPADTGVAEKAKGSWTLHPDSTIVDVPAIAKHISARHTPAGPHTVEVPVVLFAAIGFALDSCRKYPDTATGSRFPAGTFDPSDDVLIQPVAPSLATATLIRYEWRAVPYCGTDMLNGEFANGWEYRGSHGGNCILRRLVP